MALDKQYVAAEVENRIIQIWSDNCVYHFDPSSTNQVFSIDTPPATVSGYLHLGHIYSYSHADFIARFFRMCGYNVFYPMGYDDNGLPTDRLIERRLGVTSHQLGRKEYSDICIRISKEAEQEYQDLWQRIGLSVDWRYTYRTIDDNSRRLSQNSFLDLYKKGYVYRDKAPAIWCPECRVSIAQADVNDLDIQSQFFYLSFEIESGDKLVIATTRPELLPACVAVFVHPSDLRYQKFIGASAIVPLYNRSVPVYADSAVDPNKGTGMVMCCTFGDSTDITWWHDYSLPLIQVIDRDGKMSLDAGDLAGLSISVARKKIVEQLFASEIVTSQYQIQHSIRVHERCDTPVEYLLVPQWFIKIMTNKDRFLSAGANINWVPDHMAARFRSWVENLSWDWCISRQRYFGIPFPLWYCAICGEVILADQSQLPVDPLDDHPPTACPNCKSDEFVPETDTMDTWATSSMTPQIVGKFQSNGSQSLYEKVFPFSLRPQGHEIIRTWAFYSIVKSLYHFGQVPWKNILISGWGLAGDGLGKISKSRGGGPLPPMAMIEKYSADAVRYWAASSSPGRDTIINEEKIQAGARLATKLWNVARFSERFLSDYDEEINFTGCSPADRWILSRLNSVITKVTEYYRKYDYASAKTEVESFFWTEFADNYLEMCKQRLYSSSGDDHSLAINTLSRVFISVLKLLAPIMPFVTDEIYCQLFKSSEGCISIHRSSWPIHDPKLTDAQAEILGGFLTNIATVVRRYKSEKSIALGKELSAIRLAINPHQRTSGEKNRIELGLAEARADLMSITRARQVDILQDLADIRNPYEQNPLMSISIHE